LYLLQFCYVVFDVLESVVVECKRISFRPE
jgi:hypothetical protein